MGTEGWVNPHRTSVTSTDAGGTSHILNAAGRSAHKPGPGITGVPPPRVHGPLGQANLGSSAGQALTYQGGYPGGDGGRQIGRGAGGRRAVGDNGGGVIGRWINRNRAPQQTAWQVDARNQKIMGEHPGLFKEQQTVLPGMEDMPRHIGLQGKARTFKQQEFEYPQEIPGQEELPFESKHHPLLGPLNQAASMKPRSPDFPHEFAKTRQATPEALSRAEVGRQLVEEAGKPYEHAVPAPAASMSGLRPAPGGVPARKPPSVERPYSPTRGGRYSKPMWQRGDVEAAPDEAVAPAAEPSVAAAEKPKAAKAPRPKAAPKNTPAAAPAEAEAAIPEETAPPARAPKNTPPKARGTTRAPKAEAAAPPAPPAEEPKAASAEVAVRPPRPAGKRAAAAAPAEAAPAPEPAVATAPAPVKRTGGPMTGPKNTPPSKRAAAPPPEEPPEATGGTVAPTAPKNPPAPAGGPPARRGTPSAAPPAERAPKNPRPAAAAEPAPKNPKGGRPTRSAAAAEDARIHSKLADYYSSPGGERAYYRGSAVVGGGYVPASFGGRRQDWAEQRLVAAEAEHGLPEEGKTYPVPAIEGREHLQDRRSTKVKASTTEHGAPVVPRAGEERSGSGGSNLQGANAILQGTGQAYSSPRREPTMVQAPKNQTTRQPKRKAAGKSEDAIQAAHEATLSRRVAASKEQGAQEPAQNSDLQSRREAWNSSFMASHSPAAASIAARSNAPSMTPLPTPRPTPHAAGMMEDLENQQMAREATGEAAGRTARSRNRVRQETARGPRTPPPASTPAKAAAPLSEGQFPSETEVQAGAEAIAKAWGVRPPKRRG